MGPFHFINLNVRIFQLKKVVIMSLALYAVTEQNTRGRQYPVELAKDRNQFQRDYTRILHSTAFRRLQHKTQVFSANRGDLFRTRMSHSLEVEQISRSGAKQLKINEDLCAALALGHDLGHAPFGHMGQDILNDLMKNHGGFEHNIQALRIVQQLECPYPEYRGLNLMFETREGLLKHCPRQKVVGLGDVAARHLFGKSPTLEAQLVDWSDAIAYCHADLEDAFVMGLLKSDDLMELREYRTAWERIRHKLPIKQYPGNEEFEKGGFDAIKTKEAVIKAIFRDMMAHAIEDLVRTTKINLETYCVKNLDDVRNQKPLVCLSDDAIIGHFEIKEFSRRRIYTHTIILEQRKREETMLRGLFRAFEKSPELLQASEFIEGEKDLYVVICDHIAGMTDRYVAQVYEEFLSDPQKINLLGEHVLEKIHMKNLSKLDMPVRRGIKM